MKKIFFIGLLLITSVISFAQIVNVSEYGIVPGRDVTFEVNQLIQSLKGKEGVTLFFPKGQYEFYPENALEKYRAVTNHDNSLKRLAFPLFGLTNFTLDGNGSTFMFHGKICPITVEGSTNTVLKNFTIDWEHSFINELVVVENNTYENSFVAEVNDGQFQFEVKDNQILFQHYDWWDVIGQNIAYDGDKEAAMWHTKDYFLKYSNKTKITKLNKSSAKFVNITKETPPVGTVFATYGPSPGGNRFAQAIHLSSSKDNFIQNVTVLAAGGMALIAERCENVNLDGFKVTPRSDRHMATRADATHFLGCKGLIKIENCLLEKMMDDGINVHGAYIKVEEYRGENTFLCEISHRQQWGLIFAEPGDKIMLTSRETVLPIQEMTVTKTEVLNDKRVLITVAETPKTTAGLLSFENITWNPDLYVNNNTIRNNRARAALITTKGKVLVENNYFSSQMHGILIEGDNKAWYESGGVREVVIKNNVFENIGYGNGESYPLFASPMLTEEQKLGAEKYHFNITFSNNKVNSFNGHLVYAKSVKGLKIEENTIELSKYYPTGSKKPAFEFDYCEDVFISKNSFKGFDWPIFIKKKDSDLNFKVKRNKGISKK